VKQIITHTAIADASADGPPEMFGTVRDRLDFYRDQIHSETTLLCRRSNTYLGVQAFLIVVYASTMANLNEQWGKFFTLIVPLFLALLGVTLSAHAWPGIKASYRLIDHWYAKQTFLLRSERSASNDREGVPLFSHRETMQNGNDKALGFSTRTPWLFASVWVLLGGFSLYVHLAGLAG
jgi:uncharacterized membrane protein